MLHQTPIFDVARRGNPPCHIKTISAKSGAWCHTHSLFLKKLESTGLHSTLLYIPHSTRTPRTVQAVRRVRGQSEWSLRTVLRVQGQSDVYQIFKKNVSTESELSLSQSKPSPSGVQGQSELPKHMPAPANYDF